MKKKKLGMPCNKKGEAMVEAAMVLPVIVLTIMLLIRLFTFYLEILNTGINEHEKAWKESDNYCGKTIHSYESVKEVYMFSGGLLKTDLKKRIITRMRLLNEDAIVRAGEMID